jgi:hypothetical protein
MPMQLGYTDLPPHSRVSCEPLSDGLRVTFPGWCQGRTVWQIMKALLRLVLLVVGLCLVWALIWILILHRLFPTAPLGPAMLIAIRLAPDEALDLLLQFAALVAVALLFGNTRTVVELDREKLSVTTHVLRWHTRQELPRRAIKDLRYRWGTLKVRATKGSRSLRIGRGSNSEIQWLTRTLQQALTQT